MVERPTVLEQLVRRLLLPVIVAVLVARWCDWQWNIVRTDLGYFKNLTFVGGEDDHEQWNCTLLSTPTAVEGLSALGDGHCVFGGGGDLAAAFARGAGAAQPGAVWLFNATARTSQELTIDWRGHPEKKLVLHGKATLPPPHI